MHALPHIFIFAKKLYESLKFTTWSWRNVMGIDLVYKKYT